MAVKGTNILKQKPVQYALYGLAFLIVAYFAFKFYGSIKNKLSNSKKQSEDKKALDALIASHGKDEGGNLIANVETFNKADYNIMADSLLQAMKGFGTEEATVYAVLSRLRTKADWLRLVSAFGKRNGYTLVQWLTGDFGGNSKTRVNDILRKFDAQI